MDERETQGLLECLVEVLAGQIGTAALSERGIEALGGLGREQALTIFGIAGHDLHYGLEDPGLRTLIGALSDVLRAEAEAGLSQRESTPQQSGTIPDRAEPASGGPVSGGPASNGPVSGGPSSNGLASGGPVSGGRASGGSASGGQVSGGLGLDLAAPDGLGGADSGGGGLGEGASDGGLLLPGDQVRVVGVIPASLADCAEDWVRATTFVVRYVVGDGTADVQPDLREDFVIETVPVECLRPA